MDSLTREQLRAIYHGDVTDWSQVGGMPGEIAAFQRPAGLWRKCRLMHCDRVRPHDLRGGKIAVRPGIIPGDFPAQLGDGLAIGGKLPFIQAHAQVQDPVCCARQDGIDNVGGGAVQHQKGRLGHGNCVQAVWIAGAMVIPDGLARLFIALPHLPHQRAFAHPRAALKNYRAAHALAQIVKKAHESGGGVAAGEEMPCLLQCHQKSPFTDWLRHASL